jgi:hypothetical protein
MHVGSINGTIYVPMELTEIKAQACPNSKKLTDTQTAAMIKSTAVPPKERQKRIVEGLKQLTSNNPMSNDPMAKEFGISVEYNMANIKARVLDSPSLQYRKPNAERADDGPFLTAKDGKWNMPQSAHYIKAMALNHWGVLDLARIRPDAQVC